jgi:hypothetical protein
MSTQTKPSWLPDQEDDERPQDRYLAIGSKDMKPGSRAEVRILILDEQPVIVQRHWLNRRPYNCPDATKPKSAPITCPVCRIRVGLFTSAKSINDPDARAKAQKDIKDQYQTDRKYLVNVLTTDEEGEYVVKMFLFGRTLGQKLDVLRRYGELTDMWVLAVKSKRGEKQMEVDYDALFDPRTKLDDNDRAVPVKLTTAQKAIVEGKYDLELETIPASIDELDAALRGDTPQSNGHVSAETLQALVAAAAAKDFTLAHLNVLDTNTLTEQRAQELLGQLR